MKKWFIILSAGVFWYACTLNPGGNKSIYPVDKAKHAQQKTHQEGESLRSSKE